MAGPSRQEKVASVWVLLMSLIILSSLLLGCGGLAKVDEDDPWESWNREAQEFNTEFESTVVNPVANIYETLVPEFLTDALGNFFSNFNDIGVTVNDLLQLKMAQGGKDFSRFLINTTAGVGGLVDVATMMDLPKHNEDFEQTLGFWGVPSGNYLVLPFLGPSSPRAVAGLVGDALMNPLTYSFAFSASGSLIRAMSAANTPRQAFSVVATTVMSTVTDPLTYPFAVAGSAVVAPIAASGESRLVVMDDNDQPTKNADKKDAIDRYDYIKSVYRQQREYLVHDGMVDDVEVSQFNDDTEDMNKKGKYARIKKRYQHIFISP